MPTRWAWMAIVVVAFLGGGRTMADWEVGVPYLPAIGGLLYQLDASKTATVNLDPSSHLLTSWTATAAGSATGFTLIPSGGAQMSVVSMPSYYNALPTLQSVEFPAGSKLVQTDGGATTPMCVFIMEKTTATGAYGGIWGQNGVNNGIRFWEDNGPNSTTPPANSHQLVNNAVAGADPNMPDYGLNWFGSNGQTGHQENYYWNHWEGTQQTVVVNLADSKQTWQDGWGVLGAYTYNARNHAWPKTALGNYYYLGDPSGGWSGQIAEVLAYDHDLSDEDRWAVESYLMAKWQWPIPYPGDINRDGEVGPEDFGILKDNWAAEGGPSMGVYWDTGDMDGDGEVGPEDFGIVKDNFGLDGLVPLMSVPEPGCLASLLAAATVLPRRRHRPR
ncbi:MAG: dockerin type I domain-containing protein [Planctomycetota bacterium]|nr:dockerin type I domain-containing protein [Planctomycetota bacterium]